MLTTLIFSLSVINSARAFTATSWGKNRLDVFGLFPEQSSYWSYWHKYYTPDGGWEPHNNQLENLYGPDVDAEANYQDVSSVSWGPNHLDLFATVNGTLWHIYWNSNDNVWEGWDELPSSESSTFLKGAPSTASWGEGRIDVVSSDKEGKYLHLYYNQNADGGGEWKGWEDPWNSPTDFSTAPVIIAPDQGHFDVFGRLSSGTIVHLYWDGEKYSNWEPLEWKAPEIGWDRNSSLTASTWKNGSWDLWALAADGSLWHTFWRGAPVNEFFPWENITDGLQFDATPKVVHWSTDHTDVFGLVDETFYHKYWAGGGWTGWKSLGAGFASPPEVVSWGEGQYAVLGIDSVLGFLWAAMYVDNEWHGWEMLGVVSAQKSGQVQRGKASGSGEQAVLQGHKQGL